MAFKQQEETDALRAQQEEQAEMQNKLKNELLQQYGEAKSGIAKIRDDSNFTWDEREALLLGDMSDRAVSKTKSNVNTQELVNIVFDGAARIMAQFPTGKIFPTSKSNIGSTAMVNLVFNHYIIPHANAQFPLLTKFRLWDVYSKVYGSMPALVDYTISPGYIGPDIRLINPRHMFPQAGVSNIDDADYVFIDNWVSVAWLKQRDREVWSENGLNKVITDAMEGGPGPNEDQSEFRSYIQKKYDTHNSDVGKYAKIKLTTRYERDRWITFVSDTGVVLRDIANPQKNDMLPVVMKECYPLLDRFYGLAEFERGKTLQYAMNSLANLYLDGVKYSIFPPTVFTKGGVVKDSIKFTPNAKWQEIIPNSIRQMNTNPQGINTFTETYSFMKASMLNMAATTDTSVSKGTDPGMGKTPKALELQGAREGARDSWDRFMMEQSISDVYNRFISLISSYGSPDGVKAPIDISLFGKEVTEFQSQYPNENILEMFDGTGHATASPESLEGNYRYVVDAGSTVKRDEEAEHEAVRDLIMLAVRVPGGLEQIAETGSINFGDKQFDFGEAMKRFVITAGVMDSDKIIRDSMPQEQATQSPVNSGVQDGTPGAVGNPISDPRVGNVAAGGVAGNSIV